MRLFNYLLIIEELFQRMYFKGSTAPAKITVTSKKEAQKLLDEVNERCSMTYRAPELFNIDVDSVIDERIDIWVSSCYIATLLSIN